MCSLLQKKKKRKELYSFDGEEDTETSDEDIAPPGTIEGELVQNLCFDCLKWMLLSEPIKQYMRKVFNCLTGDLVV